MSSRKQPIVIGVADVKNGSRKVEDAIEPLELILQAVNQAIEDSGLSQAKASTLQSSIDSLDVIRSWTWPYPDLPSLIAKRLSIKPTRRYQSEHGGHYPGKLFDEAARRISLGETKVALLTGGEALASCTIPSHPFTHITNLRSIRLCRRKEAPSTRLDQIIRRSQLSLFTNKA